MQTLGYTVLSDKLTHTPLLTKDEADKLASTLADALVVPVLDASEIEDDDPGDEYDEFLDAGGTTEELAEALGMDIT